MIICSCNVISDHDIAEAILELRKEDPLAVITPGVVFKKLGKRPNCGNCLPLFTHTMLLLDPDAATSRRAGRGSQSNGKAAPEKG